MKNSHKEQKVRCPICTAGTMRLTAVKNGHAILRCNVCGVGQTSPRGFDPTKYYTRAYFEGDRNDGYANYGQSEAVLRDEFARLVEELREVAPIGGSLLEVGCAYGFFLKEAQKYWRVHGLEISADAVQRCHEYGLTSVHQGVADKGSLSELPSLQAVVMLDVIEHLVDPVQTIELCRRKLIPGGVLMLTTGDYGSLLARLLGTRWRLMTPPQHLWFFTEAGFRALAHRQEWEVIQVAHPGKRVPLSLIVYQLGRMLGLKPRVSSAGATIGIPINLRDTILLMLRRSADIQRI